MSITNHYKSQKGFSVLELLVAMGILVVIMFLGISQIILIQRKARDTSRTTALAKIVTAVANYKGQYLKYPTASEVVFSGNTATVGLKTVDLIGPSRSANSTSRTSTRYYYSSTSNGYMLCALLENKLVQNVGTQDCPADAFL